MLHVEIADIVKTWNTDHQKMAIVLNPELTVTGAS